MFPTVQFPWYLFNKKKRSDVKLSSDKISELHNQIRDMSEDMNEKEKKKFVEKINKIFTNKYGDKWVKFKL